MPSKENGLDIEGIAIARDHVSLGLRGPILDGFAVIAHLEVDTDLNVKDHYLSFLDLGGLAVRDLCRATGRLVIIAGPMNDAEGPLAIYEWEEMRSKDVQHPRRLYTWQSEPAESGRAEKAEGICLLNRNNQDGYAVVYDSPHDDRVVGSRYFGDWFPAGLLHGVDDGELL